MQASKNIQPFELYFFRFRFLVTKYTPSILPYPRQNLGQSITGYAGFEDKPIMIINQDI